MARLAAVGVGGKIVFELGKNTHLSRRERETIARYVGESGEVVEHTLLPIAELVEGDAPFDASDDDALDRHLPLLMTIESAILSVRRAEPDLKDRTVIAVLERLISSPDIELAHPVSREIQNRLRLVLSTSRYSRRQVTGSLKKVLRSARLHHGSDGPQGYLDFIRKHF